MFLSNDIIARIQARLNETTFFPNEVKITAIWSTPKLIIAKAIYEENEIVVTTIAHEGDFLGDLIYDCVKNQMFYLMEDIRQGFEAGDEIDQIERLWPTTTTHDNVHTLTPPKLDLTAAADKLASRFNVKRK